MTVTTPSALRDRQMGPLICRPGRLVLSGGSVPPRDTGANDSVTVPGRNATGRPSPLDDEGLGTPSYCPPGKPMVE